VTRSRQGTSLRSWAARARLLYSASLNLHGCSRGDRAPTAAQGGLGSLPHPGLHPHSPPSGGKCSPPLTNADITPPQPSLLLIKGGGAGAAPHTSRCGATLHRAALEHHIHPTGGGGGGGWEWREQGRLSGRRPRGCRLTRGCHSIPLRACADRPLWLHAGLSGSTHGKLYQPSNHPFVSPWA
jgi:hypothetical protein